MSIHLSPGERNPIEGKFGQAKTAYGLDCIKARLKGTSESWIATILLMLNLVKLTGVALLNPYVKYWLSFSARLLKTSFQNLRCIFNRISYFNQIHYSRQFFIINVT